MIIADLHIHSRFSRACSKNLDLLNLEKYARIKGVDLLGTGDFQHPKWFPEINENLKEDDNGILWSKNKFPFLWQTEISLMYKQDGKGRRIHYVILAPNKEVVIQIIEFLKSKGRIDYDGRPIFGFSSIELVDKLMEISREIEIIPAHCMTSFFGLFGSKTGFDSVEECFKDNSKYIHAIETGMSADPAMLRRISSLDKYNLVSFSDSHSFWPWRLGRESTVFDCELSYKNIIKAIRTKSGLYQTIETVPDYGKYHYDGHRNCDVELSPEDSRKLNGICPKCGDKLTIGVQYRVNELADRDENYKTKDNFKDLIPLTELVAKVYGTNLLGSKKIWEIYDKMINSFKSEFNILLNVSYAELVKVVDAKLADVIIKSRDGKLKIKPGYDGVYGEVILDDKEIIKKQKSLNEF